MPTSRFEYRDYLAEISKRRKEKSSGEVDSFHSTMSGKEKDAQSLVRTEVFGNSLRRFGGYSGVFAVRFCLGLERSPLRLF